MHRFVTKNMFYGSNSKHFSFHSWLREMSNLLRIFYASNHQVHKQLTPVLFQLVISKYENGDVTQDQCT